MSKKVTVKIAEILDYFEDLTVKPTETVSDIPTLFEYYSIGDIVLYKGEKNTSLIYVARIMLLSYVQLRRPNKIILKLMLTKIYLSQSTILPGVTGIVGASLGESSSLQTTRNIPIHHERPSFNC